MATNERTAGAGEPLSVFERAFRLREEGATDEAIRAFEDALASHDGWAPAWLGFGDVLRRSGDDVAAAEAFRRATALRPSWALPSHALLHSLINQGLGQQARAEAIRFRQVIRSGAAEDVEDDLAQLVDLWADETDPDRLARGCRTIFATSLPRTVKSAAERAEQRLKTGLVGASPDIGVEALRAYLGSHDDSDGWLLLGVRLYESGDFEGALQGFQRAVSLDWAWEPASLATHHCFVRMKHGERAKQEALRFIALVRAGRSGFSRAQDLESYAFWSVLRNADSFVGCLGEMR